MTVCQGELDDFHRFASHELVTAGRDLDLEELVSQWRAEQEPAETVTSVQRGVGDAEAGRVRDLADVDDEIRSELGFPHARHNEAPVADHATR